MQSRPILTLTIAAAAALTAHRFVTAAGAHATAAGDALGVSRTGAATGEVLPVDVVGTAVVEAGGNIAAGAPVQAGTNGVAVAATASALVSRVIAGGAAGNLTVANITTSDRLVCVMRLDRDATAANINIENLTNQFTVTDANTINNTDGTNTTGDSLLVIWERPNPVRGRALAAAALGDLVEVLLT